MKLELDNLDRDTVLLIANKFSADYGSYEIAGHTITWEKGAPTIEQVNSVALDLYKAKAITIVNAKAEAKRNEYLTPGSGQALRYIKIEQEAIAALADENPTIESYPLLASEVGSADDGGFGATIKDVALTVIATSKAWINKEVTLNQLRRMYIVQVKQAETVDNIIKILSNISYEI